MIIFLNIIFIGQTVNSNRFFRFHNPATSATARQPIAISAHQQQPIEIRSSNVETEARVRPEVRAVGAACDEKR